MTPLKDTNAAAIAAGRWIDAGSIRSALAAYGLELEEVGEWAQLGMTHTRAVAADPAKNEARFVGAISAAIILGIELARSGEAS